MSAPASPREVFEKLLSGIVNQDFAGLPDLYAEDAVVIQPFALPGPTRTVGRAGLRAHFGEVPPVSMTARDLVIHETADPEVIVAEWTYDVEVVRTGRRFSTANVIVQRIRDGVIVESRDYHDHAAFTEALSA
jgi:ketosteroid isomerase-like protein